MNKKSKIGNTIIDVIAMIFGVTIAIAMLAFVVTIVKMQVSYVKEENKRNAVIAERYEVNTADMNLCKMNGLPVGDDAVWSFNHHGGGIYEHNLLGRKSESDVVIVEQNLPLPVAGTGYDAVMPVDHTRYMVINRVFNYVGDLMDKKFIVVDDRKEVLDDMTADAADRVPVVELYLALDEGKYMGYPVAAWADARNGVLGVEVWWWYDDNMWNEGGYYTLLHEIGHLLGLGHVDESAGHETVMGGEQKSTNQSMATRTFGLHDLAGLKHLWCTNPVK